MLSFHNDEKIKSKYLSRVLNHQKDDRLIKGQYWENGKGCAVGCTIEGSDHSLYEKELGIPEWLARTEDRIFEGLPNDRAQKWPVEFLDAIPLGKDLEQIKTPFLIFVLESSLESMKLCKYDAEKFPDVKKAMDLSEAAVIEMIRCHREGLDLSAARSAAESAESAWSAESAESAESAWSAARSAAYIKFADKILELIRDVK